MIPTQDSVGEFKVQYNNLGPEWGKFAGGVINLSTKSGSNQWHGRSSRIPAQQGLELAGILRYFETAIHPKPVRIFFRRKGN